MRSPYTPPPLPPQRAHACAGCGAPLIGCRADTIYCGPTCRQRGHRAVTERPDDVRAGPPNSANCTAVVSRLDPRSTRSRNPRNAGGSVAPITGPVAVVEVEVFAARDWRAVVSSDGVVCEVSPLRPRALHDDGGVS